MEIIALYNLKGGVGKTTGCVNLSYTASQDGYKCLVWDLDPQGAATFFLTGNDPDNIAMEDIVNHEVPLAEAIQATPYKNLDIVPADISARHLDILLDTHDRSPKKQLNQILKPLKHKYDFVFLDCAPGFSALAEGIFKLADVILMPVIPTTLSVRTFEIVKAYLVKKKIDDSKLMCFFNLVDVRKSLHIDVMQRYVRDYRFFQYYIPNSSEIERMGIDNKPIMHSLPNSRGAHSIHALWNEIKEGLVE